MLKKIQVSSLLVALLFVHTQCNSQPTTGNAPAENSIGKTVTVPLPLQAWQQRRKDFVQVVQGVRERKPDAIKAFDLVLTEFETKTLHRTPMENMEILGVFYVPKDGLAGALPVVVMNAALGWYDALRYASESGRAEIVNNEGFFKKALTLSGNDVQQKALDFLKNNPEKASLLIERGLKIAEFHRETATYDRKWPTAYGLHRVMCALDPNKNDCGIPSEVPREKWDEAWETAKQRVMSYYIIKKP